MSFFYTESSTPAPKLQPSTEDLAIQSAKHPPVRARDTAPTALLLLSSIVLTAGGAAVFMDRNDFNATNATTKKLFNRKKSLEGNKDTVYVPIDHADVTRGNPLSPSAAASGVSPMASNSLSFFRRTMTANAVQGLFARHGEGVEMRRGVKKGAGPANAKVSDSEIEDMLDHALSDSGAETASGTSGTVADAAAEAGKPKLKRISSFGEKQGLGKYSGGLSGGSGSRFQRHMQNPRKLASAKGILPRTSAGKTNKLQGARGKRRGRLRSVGASHRGGAANTLDQARLASNLSRSGAASFNKQTARFEASEAFEGGAGEGQVEGIGVGGDGPDAEGVANAGEDTPAVTGSGKEPPKPEDPSNEMADMNQLGQMAQMMLMIAAALVTIAALMAKNPKMKMFAMILAAAGAAVAGYAIFLGMKLMKMGQKKYGMLIVGAGAIIILLAVLTMAGCPGCGAAAGAAAAAPQAAAKKENKV